MPYQEIKKQEFLKYLGIKEKEIPQLLIIEGIIK